MAKSALKKIPSSRVSIFKIQNRRGYAAICMKNLTEGKTPVEAFYRMVKAVKRKGFLLAGEPPKQR